jgi:hypothetical protein
MGAQPVGLQIQGLLLELVFHFAPRTVKLFIEPDGQEPPALFPWEPLARQIGHHEARVVSQHPHLRLANYPARPAPGPLRLICKLGKHPHAGPAQTMAPTRLSRRPIQLLQQHGVLGQTQTIIHGRLSLTPSHDLLPAKAAVPAHDDPGLAATLPDGRHHLRQRRHHPAGGVLIAAAQLRPQRSISHKGVERQIAIAVVIGAEVPPLLLAVQQVPHRIQINHDFRRVLGQTAHSHLQQTRRDLDRIVPQLVATRVPVVGQLQTVERGGPGQRQPPMTRIAPVLAQRIHFVAGGRQERIVPQLRMIIDICVPQRLGIDTLRQQLGQGVIHKHLLALIPKALRQSISQTQVVIHLAQQQHAAIAGERAAGKIGHDLARTQVLKPHRVGITVCPRSSAERCFHLAE